MPISRTRANHVNIQGWEGTKIAPAQLAGAAPGASTINSVNAWFIQDYGLYQETTQDTRINGRLALQWRPAENLLITLDDNYARDTLHARQYGYSVWFNAGSLNNVTQNSQRHHHQLRPGQQPHRFPVAGQRLGAAEQRYRPEREVGRHATSCRSISITTIPRPGSIRAASSSSIDVDVGYGPSTPGGTNGTNLGITVPGGHAPALSRPALVRAAMPRPSSTMG